MKLKILFISIAFIYLFGGQIYGQMPSYYFTISTDTVIESNLLVIAGYVKTDTAPLVRDSIAIILKSGSPRPSHMDTSSSYTIFFNPGQDSVAFTINISKDTFPEYPENVLYVLSNPVNGSSIGADSSFMFVLVDTTPRAILSFVSDTGSAWIHSDTFPVCVEVNNPNTFYVRYYTRTYDCWFHTPLAILNACGGSTFDYEYNWDTLYAPPGISTICENIYIVPNTSLGPDKNMMVVIQNIDANILVDSTFIFTIKNDNYYTPPSISFDISHLILNGDTALHIGIPITVHNSNWPVLSYFVDTMNVKSNLPGPDFTVGNRSFGYGHGDSYDTIWVDLLNRHLIDDTVNATFVIRGVQSNTSPDTLFQLTIIDTGTLFVSFKGAGFAHLKDDSIGYVQVYTNSPATYPVTANVSYLNGDAVAGVDYLWRDTTVTFPPLMYDTISLPVIMLKNHIHDGNKQVNFLLSNVSPSSVQYDIIQYTYTIIDNDSTAAWAQGIINLDNNDLIKVYPNPFGSELNIRTATDDYEVSIINMLGETVYNKTKESRDTRISVGDLPVGIYMLRISTSDNSYIKMITKR